ncbi:DUF305 domain-containing protein [Saccharopolyspora gloriosae]|uniref:DUF305 domain-containing protein n=1 Tax=Saccharopolyspora gloriosae TaxID=455344 RepID=UPI001FB8382F|nr:DUF305 domain-containing protein [Saccharopolyspora gloriosae]
MTGSPLPARIAVAVGAAVALLLLGGAVGLLLATPSQDAEPAASAVDIGFAQDMSTHHQQAVTMATLAREHGADVAVRQLAFDIETNQRDQIGRMQGWLNLWGEPVSSAGAPMQWMQAGGHEHGMSHSMSGGGSMPGMADTAELDRLRSLNGPEFDTYFLQLMLRHHEGGAPMARYGAEHAGLGPVRGLAANMLGSQSSESELMRGMLADRAVRPLPAN